MSRNPRAWAAGLGVFVAVGVLVFFATGGGVGFSRFFAATDQNDGSGDGDSGGGTPSCTLSGTTCGAVGIVNHYIDCGKSENGENCSASGKVCELNGGSPSVIAAKCVGAASSNSSGDIGGTGDGQCTFKENFNAPEGAWFCKQLQCQLDGNPSGGKEYPPEGPASRMNIEMFGTLCDSGDTNTPTVGCTQRLNATPKCANGKECYPPKDPLWSCTGPIEMGRNGSDFYDCYVPRVHLTGPGQVTCTGNTDLSGDSITFTVVGPGGAPAPGVSAAPVPTPDYPPPVCAPENQTAEVGQRVRLTATGGSGAFTWDISGGGVVDEGGNADISVIWRIEGLKAVQVNSGGKNDRCTVQIGQLPGIGVADGRITLTKTGRNLSLQEPEPHDNVSVTEGQIVQVRLFITNTTDSPLTGVLLRDTLPQGMSYRAGSLAVGGAAVLNDDVTTTGLAMGTLGPRDTADVTYSLVADNVDSLPQGEQAVQARAIITSNEGASAEAVLNLMIEGTGSSLGGGSGSVGAAGGAETGPDDALILALLIASASALLYTGYTRSPAFRRRELENIGRKNEPTDFRS